MTKAPETTVGALELALELAKTEHADRAAMVTHLATAFEGRLPHGTFTLYCSENDRGPDGKPSMHVTCSCGRVYAFGQRAESGTLLRWLANHDIDPEEVAW